ncbi:hypothetical protein GGI26_000862 [Coemansia sp. RSA 1358]|nr:hypothetical protein GGI26_000862 [Coemansia sp. RSA 1358]
MIADSQPPLALKMLKKGRQHASQDTTESKILNVLSESAYPNARCLLLLPVPTVLGEMGTAARERDPIIVSPPKDCPDLFVRQQKELRAGLAPFKGPPNPHTPVRLSIVFSPPRLQPAYRILFLSHTPIHICIHLRFSTPLAFE